MFLVLFSSFVFLCSLILAWHQVIKSFCVRKQAPLPGEPILQAFSGLSVLPQGFFCWPKSRSQEFWNPQLLKMQVVVSGSLRPCWGNPFCKLLVASQCSRRVFFLAEKSVPGILEPPIVENTSFCVRKQAPLPGESILGPPSC